MFAVVKTGGKQYKVQIGATIDVEKLAAEEGAQVQLDEVLLAANDGAIAYGQPVIDGAVVTASVVRQHRGPKLTVFKYKSKSRYRRRTGHRQPLTQLLVQSIAIPGWETAVLPPRPVREPEQRPEAAATAPAQESASAPLATEETIQEPLEPIEPRTEDSATDAALATGSATGSGTPGYTVGTEPAPMVEGSAAPPNDVLPAIDPTAQVAATDEMGDRLNDPLLTLPPEEPPTGLPPAGLPEDRAE